MKQDDLLTAPIGRTLFFKALPTFVGLFSAIAYTLVDTFFVGWLGTEELAAMSFSFPIVMILMNAMFGIATGIASLLSQAVGAKDSEQARRLASRGLELTIIFSLLISVIGIATLEPCFTLLGVDSQLMPLVKEYMWIWYAGILFSNLTIAGNALFRAKGSFFFPSLMLALGALFNAVLDPILIFGWGPIPKMGIQGAALTTVIGNGLSALFIFLRLKKKEKISLPIFPRSWGFSIWKKILSIALPTAVANSLTPLATAVTNWLLVIYGHAAIAGNSIATRIETVPFIAVFALCSVLVPFIGQNWGAKNFSRIREVIKKTFLFSYSFGALTAFFCIIWRHKIVSFFDQDPQVVEIGSLYLSLIPFSYGLLGTVFLTMHAMNAINKPLSGNLLSLFRLILLYLPMAYFLQPFSGAFGIFQARLIANVITGILATFLVWKMLFRKGALEEVS